MKQIKMPARQTKDAKSAVADAQVAAPITPVATEPAPEIPKIGEGKKKKVVKHFDFVSSIKSIQLANNGEFGLSKLAAETLNNLLTTIVAEVTKRACIAENHKTISPVGIEAALSSIKGTEEVIAAGRTALASYTDNSKDQKLKGSRKQDRANLNLPVARIEKQMRKNISGDHILSSKAVVFLTGAVQKIIQAIQAGAVEEAKAAGLTRIKNNHLARVFETLPYHDAIKFYFQDGCVAAYNPHTKTTKTRRVKRESGLRHRRGGFAVKEINRLQNSNEVLLRPFPFQRDCRVIASTFGAGEKNGVVLPKLKYRKQFFVVLQKYVETLLVDYLRSAAVLVNHSDRTIVQPKDILAALQLRNLNYNLDNTQTDLHVSSRAVHRISQKAGAKSISSAAIEIVRVLAQVVLKELLQAVVNYAKVNSDRTVSVKHLATTLEMNGVHLPVMA